MKEFLSVVASVCVAVLVSLSILPGPVHGLGPVGHGGVDVVLVPAGDDPGGH